MTPWKGRGRSTGDPWPGREGDLVASIGVPRRPVSAAGLAVVDVQADVARLDTPPDLLPRWLVELDDGVEEGPRIARSGKLEGPSPAPDVGHRTPAAEQPV